MDKIRNEYHIDSTCKKVAIEEKGKLLFLEHHTAQIKKNTLNTIKSNTHMCYHETKINLIKLEADMP